MGTNPSRLPTALVDTVRSGLRRAGIEVGRARSSPFRPRSLDAEPRTILDIGSADGTPELYDAYPHAAVVAIDPIAEQIEVLRPRLAHRDVEFVNVAVGAEAGTASLHVDPSNLLKSSINDRTTLTSSACELRDRTVPVRTLDVLRGAATTLQETAVLHCETSVGARFEGGYRFRDLARLLIDAGFDLVDLTAAPRGADGRTSYADCVWIPVAG